MNTKIGFPGTLLCLALSTISLSATEPQGFPSSNRVLSGGAAPSQPLTAALAADTDCEGAIDLVFVVDSSWSIAGCMCDAFEKMKAFAKNVVNRFQVGPSAAHFGIVDFSSTVERVLSLSDEATIVNAALDGMPFLGDGTATAAGLIQAQQELEARGRPGVAHVILLITDGHADEKEAAEAAAAQIKAAGTEIFTIGVTEWIDVAELAKIASAPPETHSYNVEAFDGLMGLLQTLVTNICPPANADLALSKTDSADPVLMGSGLTYTIIVSNNGPANATGVAVKDVLPAGLEFVSAEPSRGEVAAAASPLTWNIGELASGASATLAVAVTAGSAGLLCNEASVSANEADPNPANNRVVQCTTVQSAGTADLVITKAAAPDPVITGSNLVYTITVRNNGPGAATGVIVSDALPAGADFVSANSDRNTIAISERLLTWTVGQLDSGVSASLTIVLKPLAPGQICNEASVKGNEPDPVPGDNQVQACSTVVAPATADLAITKVDAPDPVVAGGELTYTINVQNNGPASATGVTITDLLPAEASFISATPGQGTFSEQGGILTCSLGTLASGASATIAVAMRPNTPGPALVACERALDVVFVIDSSGSVSLSAGAFDKIKAFAKNVVSKFRINAAGAHFGIVDFSSPVNSRLITALSDNATSIVQGIETMPLFGNGTDIAGGLALASAEIAAHGRPGVNHTVILLTDGKADDGLAAEKVAAQMKAAGIELFTVGVTDGTDQAQLQRIASAPAGNHVFKVDDFDGLSSILQQLVINVCPPAPETVICNTVMVEAIELDPNSGNNKAVECTVVKSLGSFRLAIARSGKNVIISWPGWARSCVLEAAFGYEVPLDWAPVLAAPVLAADRLSVTEPAPEVMKVYRLRSP